MTTFYTALLCLPQWISISFFLFYKNSNKLVRVYFIKEFLLFFIEIDVNFNFLTIFEMKMIIHVRWTMILMTTTIL